MVNEPAMLLNDGRAAALLCISKATLWRHVQAGVLPRPVKIGGATRWRRDELLAAIDAASMAREHEAA
jgi:predicted DNA-binding transcriptional regulator AlpA